ncbi:hypothetical protein QVD17_26504 [Tagetes erecta]|uniref:Meiotic nuclear division protein 1 homolog n=1 Tax=Tagetes erecta TaxID=13708 RepID=A0AAD8NQD8_TARER|nr:hypothetical protein QVD17_26504 [Tagetes erecta]
MLTRSDEVMTSSSLVLSTLRVNGVATRKGNEEPSRQRRSDPRLLFGFSPHTTTSPTSSLPRPQETQPFPRLLLFSSAAEASKVEMSKKRGLSLEEKREKMLQIFYDSQDFYLLKELEKLGPRKGVISQSVKDVVQSLVDDDLVSKDKIGTSVYFWSLPSCAGNQLRNVSKKLESELESSRKRHLELVEQCESLKKGREDSDAREEALSELKAIEEKYNDLKAELGQYADNDPATFEAMKEAVKVAHEASNRWTDNIFTLRQWCSNNFPQAKEQLEHLYNEVGITEDFDYIELPAVMPIKQVEE